jgi:uncharacterized 2Fe-2S/4Fe-4S cluster protein (DUF4445 family)
MVQAESKILTDHAMAIEELTIDEEAPGTHGVAVDLGTTTVVAYLLDLSDGTQLGSAATLNPQIAYGEDIVTRITYAQQNENGSSFLQSKAVRSIEDLIQKMCSTSGITFADIGRISVVGNTAMHHMFLGLDTTSLGRAPYEPATVESCETTGSSIGFSNLPSTKVYCAPNIAGFVGGDTVAFILSQKFDLSEGIILGSDIGTNGEIVLSKSGELYCCSAAAGSAFEGATISQGMRGQEGAIEHVTIIDPSESPDIGVIGGGVPRGICGSGIVDVVAELLRHKVLDKNGVMHDTDRIIHNESSIPSYVLVETGEKNSDRQILFTQKDVRQVQLAKGAILAGASILMREADVTPSDIDAVYLAGAFGSYIDPRSAVSIGLLPSIDVNCVVQVGNAAGDGAKKMLLSSHQRETAEKIASTARYVELASDSQFETLFLRATLLGDHIHD